MASTSTVSEPIEAASAPGRDASRSSPWSPCGSRWSASPTALSSSRGQLQGGDRREYPNVPIYLTATELAAVELDYKGHRYPTGHSGHERIQFDFSNR
jgi:hypothetical protein